MEFPYASMFAITYAPFIIQNGPDFMNQKFLVLCNVVSFSNSLI